MNSLNGRKSSRKELEAALVMLRLEVLDLNARLGHALSTFDVEFDLSDSGEITNESIRRLMAFLKKEASKLPETVGLENKVSQLSVNP